MSHNFRRIITGEGEKGTSCILSDETVEDYFGLPGVLDIYPLWECENNLRIPFTRDVLEKGKNGSGRLLPDAGGSKFMIEVAWPEKQCYDENDAREMFKSIGSESALMENDGSLHPGMHRTDTIDYLIILSGSITMILENEEVSLEAGDFVIQGGVAHTWANRSSAPCVILAVVIGSNRQ